MAVKIAAVPIGVDVVQSLRWPDILLNMKYTEQNAVVKLAYLLMHLICYPLPLILSKRTFFVGNDEIDLCRCIA